MDKKTEHDLNNDDVIKPIFEKPPFEDLIVKVAESIVDVSSNGKRTELKMVEMVLEAMCGTNKVNPDFQADLDEDIKELGRQISELTKEAKDFYYRRKKELRDALERAIDRHQM